MDELEKQMVTWDADLEKSTERLFLKLRATLTTLPQRQQLYGVQFEQQFAQMCGSIYAISTFTSSVLRHVLQSMNLSEGDEVICPAWIRPEYVRSILASKLIPVFAEVSPYTLGLDYPDVSHKLSPKTKVIILAHSYGIPADIESFVGLCKDKKLKLIEVVASELGSTYKEKTLGTFGQAGIIEYHPRHSYSNQDACILVTDQESIAKRVRSMSFYEHTLGTFSEFQGALGLWDINNLDVIQQKKKEVAYRFDRAFGKISGVSIFHELTVSHWGHQVYPIRVWTKCRDDLLECLQKNGFAAEAPKKPAHLHSYIQTRLRPAQLLTTERLNKEVILLPTLIRNDDQERMIQLVADFFRNLATM
ncbi:MAG: DegT/DnrJ/EryC1/StrS aminotransferase family protein [Bdellovibrionota bacterium]